MRELQKLFKFLNESWKYSFFFIIILVFFYCSIIIVFLKKNRRIDQTSDLTTCTHHLLIQTRAKDSPRAGSDRRQHSVLSG